MLIKAKALIKGVANKEWQGKQYHSIECFGVEGAPADFSVRVDFAKPAEKALFEQAEKLRAQIVDMVIDMTFFDRRPSFNIVSLAAGPAK